MNRCTATRSALRIPWNEQEPEDTDRVTALLSQLDEVRLCNKRLQYDNLRLDGQLEVHEEKVRELKRQITVLNSQIEQLNAEIERQRGWIEPFRTECEWRCNYYQGQKNYFEDLANRVGACNDRLSTENEQLKVHLSYLRYQFADKMVRLIRCVPGFSWTLRKTWNVLCV